jgi:hypothetical protein
MSGQWNAGGYGGAGGYQQGGYGAQQGSQQVVTCAHPTPASRICTARALFGNPLSRYLEDPFALPWACCGCLHSACKNDEMSLC